MSPEPQNGGNTVYDKTNRAVTNITFLAISFVVNVKSNDQYSSELFHMTRLFNLFLEVNVVRISDSKFNFQRVTSISASEQQLITRLVNLRTPVVWQLFKTYESEKA